MTDKYKLVPIEPTEKMADVGWTAFRDSDKPAPFNMLKDAYKAMLNAAPTPPNTITIDVDEYERLRKDAERYRFLKSKHEVSEDDLLGMQYGKTDTCRDFTVFQKAISYGDVRELNSVPCDEGALDEAIDKARSEP
jgi:hypothetical protein